MGVFPFPMPFSGPPKFGTMFSPLSLFAASEPGGWYDPSDLTTLYQDAAGTTPLTAVEQPVGLVLDKSRGLVLGSELVTNGDFSNGTTGWTAGSASLAVSGGALEVTNSGAAFGNASQLVTVVVGKTYKVTATLTNGTTFGYINLGSALGNGSIRQVTGPGTVSFFFTAASANCYIQLLNNNTSNGTALYDNISVRELPGSHLSQSTAAARPVLSGRVNLLTYTEAFDNAAWTKENASILTNQETAPDGTNTVDHFVVSPGANYHTTFVQPGQTGTFTFSVWARKIDLDFIRVAIHLGGAGGSYASVVFNIANGTVANFAAAGAGYAVVGTPTITPQSGGYRCSATLSGNAAFAFIAPTNVSTIGAYGSVSWTGNSEKTAIWGADLRPANAGVGLPAYQRVGAATDYDTTGFPLYLKFDGTDDFLQSSTITPGADKAQVFAGVRKTAGGDGCIYELSTNWNTNNGSLQSFSTNPGFDAASRGTAAVSGTTQVASVVAAVPATAVLAVLHDIAGDLTAHRLNGAAAVNATGDKGTGNFDNYPLYVGRRGGTTLAFNGHLYSLILRFSAANLDAATITATETWVNQRTKAF